MIGNDWWWSWFWLSLIVTIQLFQFQFNFSIMNLWIMINSRSCYYFETILWCNEMMTLTLKWYSNRTHRSQVTEHSSVPMPGLLAMTNHKADPTSIVTFIDKLAKRDMAIQSLPTALVVALSKMDKGAVAAAGGTTDWSDDDYQTYVIWHTSPLSDWTACHCSLHFAFHLVMSSMLLHSVESACQWVQCPLVLGNHSSSNISSRWFCLNEVACLVSG